MKLSIILPTCEAPIGSGRPHYFFKKCIESVFNGGHDDFELLIGCDGRSDAIRSIAESFKDDRIKYTEFPLTRKWGNPQRHEFMRIATGGYACFMDHDDAYVPGALKAISDDCDLFNGMAFYYRVKLRSNIIVWVEKHRPREGVEKIRLAGHGVIGPLRTGFPLWPSDGDRGADLRYMVEFDQHAYSAGKGPIWVPSVIVHIRPWAQPERLDFAFASVRDGMMMPSDDPDYQKVLQSC